MQRQPIPQFSGPFIAVGAADIEPHIGPKRVHRHAMTLPIHHANGQLGAGITPLGQGAPQPHRHAVITGFIGPGRILERVGQDRRYAAAMED
jgi:hypothetical protein